MRGNLGRIACALALATCVGCGLDSASDEAVERDTYKQRVVWRHTVCEGRFALADTITPGQQLDIEIAMRRWNVFLGYDYFSISPYGGCLIKTADLSGTLYATFENGTAELTLDTEWLALHGRAAGPRFQTVLIHELGHSLGISHIDAYAVMARHDGMSSEDFTDADLKECRRIRFCQ